MPCKCCRTGRKIPHDERLKFFRKKSGSAWLGREIHALHVATTRDTQREPEYPVYGCETYVSPERHVLETVRADPVCRCGHHVALSVGLRSDALRLHMRTMNFGSESTSTCKVNNVRSKRCGPSERE